MPSSDDNNPTRPRFVEAALPLPLRRTFTYRVPSSLHDEIKLGARLLVPFGKRSLTGYAVVFHSELDADLGLEESAIKDVLEIIDDDPLITEEILNLTRWTADYYAASWGELLKASLPSGINTASQQVISITNRGRDEMSGSLKIGLIRSKVLQYLSDHEEAAQRELNKLFGESAAKRAVSNLVRAGLAESRERVAGRKVKPKMRKAVRLLDNNDDSGKPLTSAQEKIVSTLENNGEMLFTDLLAAADVGASSITTLLKRGVVEVFAREIGRDPLSSAKLPEINDLILNSDQNLVFGKIEVELKQGEYAAFLLHGVTGSGKTEVYIRAMRAALDLGKSALMLVPEIALTPIFSRRLRADFGKNVAILHSNLSQGERYDEWRRIRSGQARIVIGTRSAVFAPLSNIGLVIVDEEHDSSYRQNESPFYNARDVAVMRANVAGAVAVLGSATPALESYQNARDGKYEYLRLENRIGGRPLASAELIDMREVFRKAGKDVVFSPQLVEAITQTHAKGEQTIILLNRRGFSVFVLCRTCGESLRCRNCDITLTYHRRDYKLVCHYCSYTARTPDKCPFCESEFLYFIGQGTEQLEEILHRKFPDLRVARIDRDTMARRGQMTKALLSFDAGELDMLVGTQMLAKGHDFQNVTLVGVISVDTGLGLPDFRSAERTFQLLTQVAGRAGRGNLPGRVLIQTYYPDHYALRHARSQDFEGFFKEEIRYRQRLSYPPFVVLASIMIKHSSHDEAVRNAGILKELLDRANSENACRILGPAPASIARLKSEYRLQILLKSASRKSLREILDIGLADAEAAGCDMRAVRVEIDPINLM